MATSVINLQLQLASSCFSPTTKASSFRTSKTRMQALTPTQGYVRGFSKISLLQQSHRGKVRAAASNDEGEKKVPLWRKELSSPENPTGENSPMRDDFLQNFTMEEDIARLQKKRELEKRVENFERTGSTEDPKGNGTKEIIDKVLVADFFFIIFILAWLLAGLGEKAVLETSTLIDSWLPLWPTLFQPALGIFMAGAIVSALSGYFKKEESK